MPLRIKYWTTKIFWRALYFFTDWVLYLYNRGNGDVVPPIKNTLLLKSAKQLAKEIRSRKLKSEEVVQAYIERIKEVEPFINAIAEERFKEALQEAMETDDLIQSGKWTQKQLEEEKPLLGIPFTVKCLLNVKGLPTTAGTKILRNATATEDAASVSILKKSGGIVIATSNTPEFGLAVETNNLLYGRTCNPYDTSKTTGGSSGGEGALLGAGASVIGLGNDLAGSVRMPAHFTSTYSHKATVGLIPNTGTYTKIHPDVENCLYTGPMCRYSEDLILLTKILTAGCEKKLNIDQQVKFKNLRIFYMSNIDNPMAKPVDLGIVEAIHKAVSYFTETYGATATEVNIHHMEHASFISMHHCLPAFESIIKDVTLGRIIEFNILTETIKFFLGKSTLHLLNIYFTTIIKYKLFLNEKDTLYYKNMYRNIELQFDSLLDENSVLLLPTFPVTAPYHYSMLIYFANVCYCSLFNLLGNPVTNCPIGINKNGMPQGMQIVGKKNNDVLPLACAVELDKVFGGWIAPRKL